MSNAPAKIGNKNNLKAMLSSMKDDIAQVAPKQLTPDRMLKVALIAASRNPRLFECTRQSVAQSIIRASELGLDCSGSLGSGYLVPYYNSNIEAYECQFIAGYRGLIDLARRSGQIRSIEARVVYEKDQFELDMGSVQPIHHKPYLRGERGAVQLVYAIAWIEGSDRPQVEYMTVDEIEGIRNRSKAGKTGPWKTDWSEMARKTVVRRLCKYLPLSPDVAMQIQQDADTDFNGAEVRVVDDEPQTSRTQQLADLLQGEQDASPDQGTDTPEPARPETESPAPSGDPSRAEQLLIRHGEIHGCDMETSKKCLDAAAMGQYGYETLDAASGHTGVMDALEHLVVNEKKFAPVGAKAKKNQSQSTQQKEMSYGQAEHD